MTEKPGLSPEDNEKAIQLYKEHRDASWGLRFANTIREDGYMGIEGTIEATRALADIHEDVELIDEATLREHPLFVDAQTHLDNISSEARAGYDASVEAGRRHFMENQEAYVEQALIDAREVMAFYETYIGVCDVYSKDEALAMADELRRERKSPNRKVMIGVMTHPLVLGDNPNVPEVVRREVRAVFPSKEEIAGGFTDDPDVFNTVHYADLYGPDGPRKSGEAPDVLKNLELVVQYGGEYLHAIQLDVTWPAAEELKLFKEKYPDVAVILQVGTFALKEVNGDTAAVIERLREYGESVDYALLDMSMGKGSAMESDNLLSMLRAIRSELPELGIAVAGGLGPESVELLDPIAREFPDVSIDAQGNLKHKDAPRDSLGHLAATHPADLDRSTDYIRKSCAILDN